MKKMKMKFGLVALSVILMFVMAACGNKSESSNASQQSEQSASAESSTASEDPAATASTDELTLEAGAELKLWVTENSQYIQNMAQDFEKQYNVKVKIEQVNSWESAGRLSTDGPAGNGADVIEITSDSLGKAVKTGVLLPNDYFEEETKSYINKQAIESASFDGILYGYPRDIYTYALYVNEDLVKDAKLDTWDDIIAFAKQFNDIKNNKYGLMIDPSSFQNWFFNASFMMGYGGYFFGNNGTDTKDIGVNNEGSVKGLEFFKSLKDILPLKAADVTGDVKTGLFESGKLAISMDGSWAADNNRSLPFKVAVLPLPPMAEGKSPLALIGTHSFAVSAYSKYPNAAKLFAHFLTSKDNLTKDFDITGLIPAMNGLETTDRYKTDLIVQGFMKQLNNSVVMPNIPEMDLLAKAMTPAITDIWDGAEVKPELDKAAQNLKDSLATMQ
jgi:arabinogalactan oligomer / maltooligosaccharide transport system substrate-binding protein